MQGQASCALLCLPGELRNQIYEYVLSDSHDIYCFPSRTVDGAFNLFRTSEPTSVDQALNQMKFTCRQLRHDTARLGPGLCPIFVFADRLEIEESASITCSRFLEGPHAEQRKALATVVVEERVPDKARSFHKRFFHLEGMSRLAKFCWAHPRTFVKVTLDCWSYPPGDISPLLVGCIIQAALRKEYITPTHTWG